MTRVSHVCVCVANAKRLDVSRTSQFSPIQLLGLAAAHVLRSDARRKTFQLLLTQAAWFLRHTCV